MKWTPRGRSRNIEDRRGQRVRRGPLRFPFPFPTGRSPAGGGARRRRIPLPAPRGKLGIGTLVLLLALMWFMGGGLFQGPGGAGGGLGVPPGGQLGIPDLPSVGAAGSARGSPEEEELVQFVSFVLDDVQETWSRLLPSYRESKLVLFNGAVRSGCGYAQSAMGPFYCPADQKVYIDLGFYQELRRRFGAPGDFAQAYVLAHEIGHHIQRLTGIEQQVRQAQQRNPRLANQLSVRMELQADCLAGVWGHSTHQRGILEQGDVEEGLNAAAAIGDDRIQGMSGSGVNPEAFTHGSSRQRVAWFRRGLETGDADACDPFGAPEL